MNWTNKLLMNKIVKKENCTDRIILNEMELIYLMKKFENMRADRITIWLNEDKWQIYINKDNDKTE